MTRKKRFGFSVFRISVKAIKKKIFSTNKIFSHLTKPTVMSNAYACELTSQQPRVSKANELTAKVKRLKGGERKWQ